MSREWAEGLDASYSPDGKVFSLACVKQSLKGEEDKRCNKMSKRKMMKNDGNFMVPSISVFSTEEESVDPNHEDSWLEEASIAVE